MRREDLLTERLKRYSASEAVAFHMPGHKRQMEYALLRDFPNPFSIDITEIAGFDNLHHPEGILKDSMEWAASVYGADHTYYLVNGSSCGILSAIGAVMRPGETLLVSRNCHKSVYHGLILNSLKPEYVYPQIIEELGIQGGIRPEDVEKRLKEHPEIRAVLIVSPTYDGVVSDIRGIAEVVHAYGIPLIVDEAHGAHFPFGKGCFPESALYCGADLVIQSLHKTLPSLTQTAVLHLNGNLVNRGRLERCLQMYQSSSPSYVFMTVMEQCIFEMQQHGREAMTAFAEQIRKVRNRLKQLQNLKLLDRSRKGAQGVFDVDESKLVISCRGVMTGEHLSECLRRDYAIEMEMCGADYAVAILTFLDSEEHLDRLVEALLAIDRKAGAEKEKLEAANGNVRGETAGNDRDGQQEKASSAVGMVQKKPEIHTEGLGIQNTLVPEICMTPAEAFNAPLERICLEESAGRISGEFIYLYPPGIPIITPGERMTEEIICQVLYDRDIGLPVQGMEDQKIRHLQVVKADEKTDRDRTPGEKGSKAGLEENGMGKIFYLMGKSASGKDSIYKRLRSVCPKLKSIVLYTTRPMRDGEQEGVEYHFIDGGQLEKLEQSGRVIEVRTYQTVFGPWSYATVDDGQINLKQNDYLVIGTLDSYEKLREYYGKEALVPLYVTVDDGVRLERAIARERQQKEPKYAELCRRFLADEADFAPDRLAGLDVTESFENRELEACVQKIADRIQRDTQR